MTTAAQEKMAKVRAARNPPQADVTALLGTISEQLGQLSQRIAAVEDRQPQFRPMQRAPARIAPEPYRPPEQLLKEAKANLRKEGDTASGRTNYLQNPEHAKKLPPEYRPIFRSGDTVRINPDAKVFGSDKVWGDVLQTKNTPGIGEVLAIQYITKSFEPKYTVIVPGLTQRDGDGFRESELLPHAV